MGTVRVTEKGVAYVSDDAVDKHRDLGPLEIQDPEKRKLAIDGLKLLRRAMELEKRPSDAFSGTIRKQQYEVGYHAFVMLGQLLLGDDWPDFEELC